MNETREALQAWLNQTIYTGPDETTLGEEIRRLQKEGVPQKRIDLMIIGLQQGGHITRLEDL